MDASFEFGMRVCWTASSGLSKQVTTDGRQPPISKSKKRRPIPFELCFAHPGHLQQLAR
jgi:hypothetical protein